MLFNVKDKALNLHQFKEYGSQRNFRRKTGKTNILLKKKIREPATVWSTDQRHESGRPKQTYTEENVTTVDELIGLLSQEDQKQTHRSTRQISRETGLTQCSIAQIIHRDLGLKCFFFVYQHACCLLLLVFLTFIFHKVV